MVTVAETLVRLPVDAAAVKDRPQSCGVDGFKPSCLTGSSLVSLLIQSCWVLFVSPPSVNHDRGAPPRAV